MRCVPGTDVFGDKNRPEGLLPSLVLSVFMQGDVTIKAQLKRVYVCKLNRINSAIFKC